MPLFVVETIQTFRIKYVVDCHSVEHALDTIAMNEADEFSQMSLGEQIIRGYEITSDQFDIMNKAANSGCLLQVKKLDLTIDIDMDGDVDVDADVEN